MESSCSKTVIRCHWIRHRFQIIFILFILLYFGILFYVLLGGPNNNGISVTPSASEKSTKDRDWFHKYDLSNINVNDLTSRVEELLDIRKSVLEELRQLEQNRSAVIKQISERNNEIDKLKAQISKRSTELERLQLHIKQAALAQKEAKGRVDALIEPPLDLLPKVAQQTIFINESLGKDLRHEYNGNAHCQMYNCFDYSRCSLFGKFYVFVYNFEEYSPNFSKESLFNSELVTYLKGNFHITTDPQIACVYMVVFLENIILLQNREKLQLYLQSLPYWGGDGRNNIILNTNSIDLHQMKINPMKAMLVQTLFNAANFRAKYDLIVPDMQFLFKLSSTRPSDFSPVVSPARRKYFLSYLGKVDEQQKARSSNDLGVKIKETLVKLASKYSNAANNEFLFDFDCDAKTKKLCENQTIILLDSTFTLLLPSFVQPSSFSGHSFTANPIIFDNQLSFRLLNALSTGAIPILVGGDFISLPFEEVIDWNRAVIRIPTARITELYVMLKTFTDTDIIELRRFGSYIYKNFFYDLKNLVNTVFSLFRLARLKIPSPPAPNEYSVFYRKGESTNDRISNLSDISLDNSFYRSKTFSDDDENVGPLELPISSLEFRRNFSITFTEEYLTWNDLHHSPFYTFPSLPIDPVLPSESKFLGSSYRFRPIGDGAGGSGREFAEALGGNIISEQFTIVILTYEREDILLGSLKKLKDLPYLNKVIVVWNSPNPPTVGIKWPEIGVDILVIKSKRNSLNNRFLPFDEIKTDAILSLDDDVSLRHDEIIFAFRVWRETRDRIVGFPARYHSWDAEHGSFLYNSNYTCEFSMVLTGAAFFHKYYTYLYTYSMPAAIRDKIDSIFNCEDLAFNLLVSHVSRKPPIKVTSRWTFKCPECSSSLSENEYHYQRRHHCLNFFASVYGYMPLLYTQFRADSVLFKTRIPHDKQKCFKYI